MGFFDKFRRKNDDGQAPSNDTPDRSASIRLVTKSGATIYVSKEEWRTRSLPEMLRANWDNPEQLANIIVGSMKDDGLFAEILEAAEHLYHTDTVPSRGTCIYGSALIQNERIDDAERVLLSYTETYGEDGLILTNLAKIYAARKQESRFIATLWHSLEIDPNQEGGLNWYAAIEYERAGPAGRVEAWQRVAAVPGSWHAQIWLARTALESHNSPRALAYYRESLSRMGDAVPTDALMQMSGDLGKHGLLSELLDLCEPLFVPEIHGLQGGNNLIKANIGVGRIENARRILNQLRMQQRPDWIAQLDFWKSEIERAR